MFKILCSLFFIFSTKIALAEVCEDEIEHLKEFGVHYLSKTIKRNSNFIYKDIPNSQTVLALSKDAADWKIETASDANGYAFVARGMMVGISGQFDKNGKCINAVTFDYDVMDSHPPESVKNMTLTFNYNFQVCQKVENILNRNKLAFTVFQDGENISSRLKKEHPYDYQEILKLTQASTENKFYKIARPESSFLIMKCMLALKNRQATRVPENRKEDRKITR